MASGLGAGDERGLASEKEVTVEGAGRHGGEGVLGSC